MTSKAGTSPDWLLGRARTGDAEALGSLLELYRNYLALQARSLVGPGLRGRLDHSDLIQETFLKAVRGFATFKGTSERELIAWLRRIMACDLINKVKHHHAQGRDRQREESLEAALDRSDQALQRFMAAPGSSPSAQTSRREQVVLLADAMAALPADYKEVVTLRSLDDLCWDEVAERMGRTSGAVKMLWSRAIVQLNRVLRG